MYRPSRLLSAVLALVLASCFEGREEIWIDSVGGGRMKFDYVLPTRAVGPLGGERAIRDQIATILKAAPELQLNQLTIVEANREYLVSLELSTDSMLSLVDLPEREAFAKLPPAATKIAGTFDLKIDGSDIVFSRVVDVGSALGFAALMISPEDRAERRTTYIIHLPTAATEHDATRVEDEGCTLIWDRTLGEALNGPTKMNFTSPLPIPWTLLIVVLLVLAVVLFLIVRWVRRRRSDRAGAAQSAAYD